VLTGSDSGEDSADCAGFPQLVVACRSRPPAAGRCNADSDLDRALRLEMEARAGSARAAAAEAEARVAAERAAAAEAECAALRQQWAEAEAARREAEAARQRLQKEIDEIRVRPESGSLHVRPGRWRPGRLRPGRRRCAALAGQSCEGDRGSVGAGRRVQGRRAV
jgi:hypothetical protein